MSETKSVVSPALALLKAAGYLVFRNNIDQRGRVKCGLGTGSADIIGLLKSGRFFAIECKAQNGKPSEDQLTWGMAVMNHGGRFSFARSPEEALELVQMWERWEVANG